MSEEIKLVNMLRIGSDRVAIIEYSTSAGLLYGVQKLHRSKEVAIQHARKMLQNGNI